MVKGFLAAIVALVIVGSIAFSNGGSDSGSSGAGYSQPPARVQINVAVSDDYVTVAIVGANSENWLWNDGNNGMAVAGNWQPSNECTNGQGHYSGEIKFWERTSLEDYANEPSAGQMVEHLVDWKSNCEPSGMTVQVFMPGE